LNFFHLIRHGQAGTRAHYDVLSDVGAEQARHLGTYLRTLPLDAVITGGLRRQQETARQAGFPDFEVDEGWSEFDLDAVYREIAPQLAEHDADFRAEFEALQATIHDDTHAVHRKWTRGDVKVVMAWVEGLLPVRDTETFTAFVLRIQAALGRLTKRPGNVAVFTSATPIGLSVAQIQNASGLTTALQLAGALRNGSVTSLRAGAEPSLFAFNIAHYLTADLHTFR